MDSRPLVAFLLGLVHGALPAASGPQDPLVAPPFRWADPAKSPAAAAPRHPWHASFDAAAEAARQRKVAVLAYFTATW